MCNFGNLGGNGVCPQGGVPGTDAELFFVPVEEVDVFPSTKNITNPSVPPSIVDEVVIEEDIELENVTAGIGYFRRIPIQAESGVLTNTAAGEVGSMSFKPELGFKIAGTDREKAGFANAVLNCCVVAVVKTKQGETYVIGSKSNPAKITTNTGSTGNKVGDFSGYDFKLEGYDGHAKIYDGILDITPNP